VFSRNRSAQLLEQPLLSRFAPDLRRRTRAFAYKPHHKIHNTSPRRTITTEDIHRSREFMQNRGGRFPRRSSVFKTKSFIAPPFSSLFQSCIGEHREAFASVSRTCTAIALSPAHRSPSPSGTQRKSRQNYIRTSEGEASPWLHRRRGPNVGRPQANATPNFPLAPTKKGRSERETTNAPSKVRRKERRKGLKKKERRRPPHPSCGETVENRGLLPNKWRLSAKNPRLLSVEVGEQRSRLAVRRRMCNFATT